MTWLVEWWDGVELWLVQLSYPVGVVLVLAVLVPAFWGVSLLVDRVIDWVAAKVSSGGEPPLGRDDHPTPDGPSAPAAGTGTRRSS